ncbi:MAG: transcription-repair coupling factor [Bdellovibrionales bacterium]|nr:transcription-repair coupling factor [Bdellovibrionales bacterium]
MKEFRQLCSSRVFVTSLPQGTAAAWEIAKRVRSSAQSFFFILVPDNVWALGIKDDLAYLAPDFQVEFLPGLESDLLRNRGPSVVRRGERIRAFQTICANKNGGGSHKVLVLITPEALCQRAPSLDYWEKNSLVIKKNQELDRSSLTSSLADLGYIPAELVETPTEYAVRGSIVDVFPPGLQFPVRIELFDDAVQSIRSFHPDSQRRIEDLDQITIPPSHEFFYPASDAALGELKSSLRNYLDQYDWAKNNREALLERIQQRSFFASVDFWGALLSPSNFVHSPWENLPDAPLYVVEPGQVNTEIRAIYKAIERNLENARIDEEWVPAPQDFLVPLDRALSWVDAFMESAELWVSLRQSTGLSTEPPNKTVSSVRGHEALSAKLSAARHSNEPALQPLIEQIREWSAQNAFTVFISPTPSQLERLQFLLGQDHIRFKIYDSLADILRERPPLAGCIGSLQQGFTDPESSLSLLLDEDIFGTKKKRVANLRFARKNDVREVFTAGDFSLLDLKVGDFVVHAEHGIGRYLGLKMINFHGIPSELLEIEYRDGSKLLVPVTRLDAIHKHSGSGDDSQLDKLGGQTWESKKSKVKRDIQNLAGELLHLYSKRELAKGPEIHPDKKLIDEFAETFPYVETPDQAAAIEKTLGDLRGPKPMDRLVCGDVGYGKTEVAMRAAHAAVAAGWQVAVLVPTTILAAQHESTFHRRLEPLGFKVAGLSRFKSAKESKQTMAQVASGEIQVLVGTHRLLSNDVKFKHLGLLIIDEEQRFGVAHKERIKKLRANVHVLTLTATPIPRTLNLALSGLKEISIITTPPADRLSVRTHVAKKKLSLIQDAVQTELKRGGQVFYVHNRIQTMPKELEEIQSVLPGVSIETTHGQMEEEELERRMLNFYEGRTQVLLTTAIIESGLDIPNANTLIVDRADAFGLAQLYQIRGRVGRSTQRAYAYFMLPEHAPISQDAEERLAVLESYQELGSGFHIASHDLELRGSGDVLGGSQSGHMLSIGIDAYMELLQESVAELKGETIERVTEPELSLGLDTTIPENYVPEIGLRLVFYRRLAAATSEDEIDPLEADLADRFGPLPESVKNLIATMKVKCQLRRLGVKSLTAGKAGYSLTFDTSTPVNPAKVVESIKRYPTLFSMFPDGRLLLKKPVEGQTQNSDVMRGIENALALLESWCG